MSKRDIESLWKDLDADRFSQASEKAFGLLKKSPDNAMLTALAALSCYKLNRKVEALNLVEKIYAPQKLSLDESNIIQEIFCGYGMFSKVNEMREIMYKRFITQGDRTKAVDLLNSWYSCMLEVGYYKGIQAVSLVFHKLLPQNEVLTQRLVFSYYLLCTKLGSTSKDPQLSAAEQKLYPMLAVRTLEKVAIKTPQQVYLKALVLSIQDESKSQELVDYLMKDELCRANSFLETKLLRLETLKKLELWDMLIEEARRYLTEELDNWIYWEALVDASKKTDKVQETLDFIESYKSTAKVKHIDYRNHLLAKVYMLKTPELFAQYFNAFSGKKSTYEDLYMLTANGNLDWLKEISIDITKKPANTQDLNKTLNFVKFKHTELDVVQLANLYTNSMQLLDGKDPKDYHSGDDFLLLAAAKVLSASVSSSGHASPSNSDILKAIVLLERAAKNDPHQFYVRLWLISLYQMLGAFSASAAHFKTLSIKNMQLESLAHLLLGRVSTQFPVAFNHTAWLKESDAFYSEIFDLGDGFMRAFQDGIYTKIGSMFDLLDNLNFSFTKTLLNLEKWKLERQKSNVLKVVETKLVLNFDTDTRSLKDQRDVKTIGLCLPNEFRSLYQKLDQPHNVSRLWLEIQLLYEDLIFEGLTPFNGIVKDDIKLRIEEKLAKFKTKLDAGASGGDLTAIERWACELLIAMINMSVFKDSSKDLLTLFHEHKKYAPEASDGIYNWNWPHYALTVLDTAKILKKVSNKNKEPIAKAMEEIKSKAGLIKKSNTFNKDLVSELEQWAVSVGVSKSDLEHVVEGLFAAQNETLSSIRAG